MFKKIIKFFFKTILYLAIIYGIAWGCTTSWFLTQVGFPFLSFFIEGKAGAKEINLSFKKGKIVIVDGFYSTVDKTAEISFKTLDIKLDFKSLLTDTPIIYHIDIQAPFVAIQNQDNNIPTQDDPQNHQTLEDDTSLFDQIVMPNCVWNKVNIKDGTLVFNNKYTLDSLVFKGSRAYLDSQISLQLSAHYNKVYDINLTGIPRFDSERRFKDINFALTTQQDSSIFRINGGIKNNHGLLQFASNAECQIPLPVANNTLIKGESRQIIDVNITQKEVVLHALDASLRLGDQPLFLLSCDSTLRYDYENNILKNTNDHDLLSLVFHKTPIRSFNFIFDVLKLDSQYQFTNGDIDGKLLLRFDKQARLNFYGNLNIDDCANRSTNEFNLERARANFDFQSWYDFKKDFDINISQLSLYNHGAKTALSGNINAHWDGNKSELSTHLELSSYLFDAIRHFTPETYRLYAPGFLMSSNFKNSQVKLNLDFQYNVDHVNLKTFKSQTTLSTSRDSLIEIEFNRDTAIRHYLAKITTYPAFLTPIILSGQMPQDYQNNIAGLLHPRKTVTDLKLYMNIKKNEYIINQGVTHLIPLNDSPHQVFKINLDSKIVINQLGATPIRFHIEGFAPAFECSPMIPIQADTARIFCNYFFNDQSILDFAGYFIYYPSTRLLRMHDIFFKLRPVDETEFHIYMSEPLENLCGFADPATDIVIKALAKTKAEKMNPALCSIDSFKIESGIITFDNTFVFSFIQDYFSIDGKNTLKNVVFNYREKQIKPVNLSHDMYLYLTDTNLNIHGKNITIWSFNDTHLNATYTYKQGRLNNQCDLFANWRTLDQMIINTADNLFSNTLSSLKKMESIGVVHCKISDEKLEKFRARAECDSIIFDEFHNQTPPLHLYTELAFEQKNNLFDLQNCQLSISTSENKKSIADLNVACKIDSHNLINMDIASNYIHLPTLFAFYNTDSSIEEKNKPCEAAYLPIFYCNVNMKLEDIEISDQIHLNGVGKATLTPDSWHLYSSQIYYQTQKVDLNGNISSNPNGDFLYELQAKSNFINIHPIMRALLGKQKVELQGIMRHVSASFSGEGFSEESLTNSLDGFFFASLSDVVIPLSHESVTIRILTLPLIFSSSINQFSTTATAMIDRKSLTDRADFKTGIIHLKARKNKIKIENLRLNKGIQIHDFVINGEILLPEYQLNNLVAIVKPIALSIVAFKIKNTLFDPKITTLDAISQTILQSLLFYTNPRKITQGIDSLSDQILPLNPIDFFRPNEDNDFDDQIKYTTPDSLRSDESNIFFFGVPKIFPF